MTNLILLNKPFQVLCQFTDHSGRRTLAEHVPLKGFYPAGRLDYDSEGLLLLTNDGALQARIANPAFRLPKTYWIQVEGTVTDEAIQQLQQGVTLKDGPTRPALVQRLAPPALWERHPPVRYRASVPDSWLEITITEGRNRQVRRMAAAVGFPVLRLVRVRIGDWTLDGLLPGEYRTSQVFVARPPSARPPHRRRGAGTQRR